MIPNKRTLTTILLVAALLLTGVAASPVAAQNDTSDDDDDGSILGPIGGVIDEALETASGAYDRAAYWLSSLGGSEDAATASDTAEEIDSFADDNEGALVAYANAHAPENVTKTDYDVVRLNLNAGGEETTVYATAEVDNDSVQTVDVVEETGRTVDLTLTLDEYATRELPSDLEHVQTNYVEADKSPESLRGYFWAKYDLGDGDSDNANVKIEGGDA